MDLQLEDKVVWVTGASGGIGRAIARLFGEEGARVALHAHHGAASARAWVAEQPWHERALVVEADVRNADALQRCADEIAETWGRIDVCAANAGVWPAPHQRLDELSPERLTDTIAVNLTGALFTAAAFLRVLADTGPRADGHGASLTFTGSTAGRFGERGHVDYAASKAGLRGAVMTLKNEIAELDPYGRVNLVEPGWTVTHMAKPALEVPGAIESATRTMALRQLARAEDIARTVLWFSSPRTARHTSGQVLTVAGGMEGRVLWERESIDRAEILRRLHED